MDRLSVDENFIQRTGQELKEEKDISYMDRLIMSSELKNKLTRRKSCVNFSGNQLLFILYM